MHSGHAAPVPRIAAGSGAVESRGLMLAHRTEAQRLFEAALQGGLSHGQALAKASRAIRAARRAQVMYRAELAHACAKG